MRLVDNIEDIGYAEHYTVMGTNYWTASYNYFLTTFEISSYKL